MTQEDKELLLKDICARLPYQPLCKKVDTEDDFCECDAPLGYSLRDLVDNKIIIKPYLRPMSSMTEEEKEYLKNNFHFYFDEGCDGITNGIYSATFNRTVYHIINENDISDIVVWLNEHHFDYRGLIEKGLALEAPEGMYSISN